MLIKDPYLESQRKEIDVKSQPLFNQQNTSLQSQSLFAEPPRNRAFSGVEVNELRGKVKAYEKQIKNWEGAYFRQQEAARKMNKFNQINRQYHQAMKLRNLELNTKIKDFNTEIQMIQNRASQQHLRHNYDKDIMFQKYQQQADEVLRLRANCNCLIQQKTRLEQELNNLTFLIEKERHQNELQIKESSIRLQSMERTYKALVSAKDQQIGQLAHRLRLYQDQNRKLNDINKTLQLTKENKIDNLSQIHHLESNMKSAFKDKENQDINMHRSHLKDNNELREQKTMNQELRRQLQNLKKQLNKVNQRNNELQNSWKETSMKKDMTESRMYETSKWQGIMAAINSLRDGINKEVFELFFKSVRDGQKKKQNSLVIFIQNWKCLDMQRLEPYLKSYFEARNSLKKIAATTNARESPHYKKIEEVIPLRVGAQPGRSNINQWILSTIQFTKNQKQSSKKCLNNYLLFLFRLLTIEYRIKYPMQGKSYHLDEDVQNQLLHEIVKAIEFVFQYQ